MRQGARAQCSYVVAHDVVGDFSNTATVTVEDDEGNRVTAKNDATVTVIDDILPTVLVEKTANPIDISGRERDVTYTVIVTNTSVETLTITSLVDRQTDACDNLIGRQLGPGETASCDYVVTHTDVGTFANTAYVTVEDDEGNEVSEAASATVTVEAVPVVDATWGGGDGGSRDDANWFVDGNPTKEVLPDNAFPNVMFLEHPRRR